MIFKTVELLEGHPECTLTVYACDEAENAKHAPRAAMIVCPGGGYHGLASYEGEPIEATYFSCSGGQTEAAVEVWGGTYPYLQAVLSPGEEEMKNFKKEVYFTKAELEKALGRELPSDPDTWIGQITYTTGGGVNTIELAGQSYTGVNLRSLLKLNSTAFTVTPDGDGMSITTSGKGHRVGMSQSGAQAMALRGYGYQTILTYYYPGAVIDKLENME